MILKKTAENVKAHITEAVSMPVRQATLMAVFALVLAVVALVIAIKR